MARYAYNGRVKVFDKIVNHCYSAETTAPSRAKAESNMKYRYKKEHNLVANAKVIFLDEVEEI